jgi:hypothetical protein
LGNFSPLTPTTSLSPHHSPFQAEAPILLNTTVDISNNKKDIAFFLVEIRIAM